MGKDRLESNLEKYFGFGEFRHSQRDIIDSILRGEDTLAVMPTGGGKSLCYQLPALLLDGVTFVVSPLIALMKDQVDALLAKGISARYINSSQTPNEQYEILNQLRAGEIKLLYIAPERFKAPSFLSALRDIKIALFAIDEAHCISQWGHDFRPDYMRLGKALQLLGKPRVAAFTATATEEVRIDILKQLNMQEPSVYVSGFARENLSFNVRSVNSKSEKFERILELIEEHKTGIIYCSTVKGVETVSEMLDSEKIKHISYNGKMTANERDEAQEEFISGKASIAVATNAFGMGIDRADIRFVCHYDLAGSIEAYYQEAGRAGRDGKESYCELLFMYADKRVQEFFIEGSNPSLDLIENLYKVLRAKVDKEGMCILTIDEMASILKKDIYKKQVNTMALSSAISVLRRYGYIERLDGEGRTKATRIVDLKLHPLDLEIDKEALEDKKRKDSLKLKSVMSFAYSNTCRHEWVLDYFGEKSTSKCGKCDKCKSGLANSTKMLTEEELIVVRKALSCIARMSTKVGRMQWLPRFGKHSVVKCLMGSKDEKILNARLNELSTYGILKGYGRNFVLDLMDSMLEAQLVDITEGDYPLMGLSDKGISLMLGERNVLFNFPVEKKKKKQEGKTKIYDTDELPCDEILYNKLVAKRNQLQHLRKVPAYVIFPNQVLKNLAELQPKTAEEAMEIKGIGVQKAATILPSFLKIIAEYNNNGGLL
ncbi:MAG: ATP-dependent DNA helicase RecQ [Opitutales bacterium]